MGALFTDYLLADATVVPEQLREHYSEELISMPASYFVNSYRDQHKLELQHKHELQQQQQLELQVQQDEEYCSDAEGHEQSLAKQAATRVTCRRAAFDLPTDAGSTVLCNFNRLHKLDPETFDQWISILQAEQSIVLWLLDCGAEATANLKNRAAAAGVHPDRLIFAPVSRIYCAVVEVKRL